MKHAIVAGVFLIANVAGPVLGAPCTASPGYSQLSGSQIQSLLVGNTACYPVIAPYTNQEYLSGGYITDYKKGLSDPIDPSKKIGTYVIDNGQGGEIVYTYTGNPNSTFTYTVWGPVTGNEYDFCVGSTPLAGGPVRIASGGPVAC